MHRSTHRSRFRSTVPALLTLLALALLILPTIAAAPAAADTQGFIYGRVLARGDTYEGRLRWDDEEAFWGDFFNGTKDERAYLDDVPRDARRKREPMRVLGINIGSRWREWDSGRQIVARFGDIAVIEPGRGDDVTLTMKSGTKIEIDGGSNDIGADIVVWDARSGEVKIDWDRIERIELMPAPADLEIVETRLIGKVATAAGTFEGYIQWDAEECLSTDILDGETRDGDVEIPMGKLTAIERRSRSSSKVELLDGRELVLDGTNDVDDDNRGIFVEDRRYGRVEIPWSAFERLDFLPPGDSGPPYQAFEPGEALRGTVRTKGGAEHRGRIVYDIDESETWELLNGYYREVEYSIPFALVRSIEPYGRDGSRVTLIGGEVLELEDAVDVDENNDGVLIYAGAGAGGAGDKPTYVAWDEVDRIVFDG